MANGRAFPGWEKCLGPGAGRHRTLLGVWERVPVERFLPSIADRRPGRPLKPRAPMARAFWAQMVLDISTTTAWVERGCSDPTLRRWCGGRVA